jgi:hypothetical protein
VGVVGIANGSSEGRPQSLVIRRRAVSRGKSDHADAMTLADILRTDVRVHRRLPADTHLAQAVAVLARAHQDATWRRTKASNDLRSLLREYYPAFLEAFAGKTASNLATVEARAVLAIAPTPDAAAKLSKARIATAMRRAWPCSQHSTPNAATSTNWAKPPPRRSISTPTTRSSPASLA